LILHPVPPVPELRTRVAKRIDRWRRGPGKYPIVVFVVAIVLSVFANTIGWMYFSNVFCMSGYDRECAWKLDGSVWVLSSILLYVNAWSVASWIADHTERRRLRKLVPIVDQRLHALPSDPLRRRQAIADELRRRGLDRGAEQPRAHFQAKILGWFRNLFVVGSAIPLLTVADLFRDAPSSIAILAIVFLQVIVLYKISKHVRRMRRIARELTTQWEAELSLLERDVAMDAPLGAERVTFRPWAGRGERPSQVRA
jgi:hypothetical protein